MKFVDLINKAGLTQTAAAEILGVSVNAVSKRMAKFDNETGEPVSDAKVWELKAIEKAIHKNLYKSDIICGSDSDKVEIPYYVNSNLKTNIKTSAITSIWFDRELVENIWRMTPENLRVTTMLGDKMDGGSYPLRKDDILIMDIADTDVTKSGVFAFTTHNDTYMYINGINRRYDGTWRFSFRNENYPEKNLTDEEVIKADIKVIGRIVKNLSLTI